MVTHFTSTLNAIFANMQSIPIFHKVTIMWTTNDLFFPDNLNQFYS